MDRNYQVELLKELLKQKGQESMTDSVLELDGVVESKLESEILLQKLQSIEVELDRVREERWGPRTIDLDIVAIEDQQHNSPNLTIPHPLAHERCFVLIPWFEIDPTSALVDKGIVANLITKLDCKELTIYQQRLVNK